jgi:dipeptidyl aminopeptidase/acylaminoacyl peptidase
VKRVAAGALLASVVAPSPRGLWAAVLQHGARPYGKEDYEDLMAGVDAAVAAAASGGQVADFAEAFWR